MLRHIDVTIPPEFPLRLLTSELLEASYYVLKPVTHLSPTPVHYPLDSRHNYVACASRHLA